VIKLTNALIYLKNTKFDQKDESE